MKIITPIQNPYRYYERLIHHSIPVKQETTPIAELPYSLQLLSSKFWLGNLKSVMQYIASRGSEQGMLVCIEHIPKTYRMMNARQSHDWFRKHAISAADQLAEVMRAVDESIEVSAGYKTGFFSFHEIMVFLPEQLSHNDMCRAMYLISSFSKHGCKLPEDWDIKTKYMSYLARHKYFCGTSDTVDRWNELPKYIIQFRETDFSDDENASVNIVCAPWGPINELRCALQDAIDSILKKAQESSAQPQFDDVVSIACNNIMRGYWEYQKAPEAFVEVTYKTA